jgi:hypothetical protein
VPRVRSDRTSGPIPPTPSTSGPTATASIHELTMVLARVIRHLDGERAERIASELANKG